MSLLKLLFASPFNMQSWTLIRLPYILALHLCSHVVERLPVRWHRDVSRSFIVPVNFSLSRRMSLNYSKFSTSLNKRALISTEIITDIMAMDTGQNQKIRYIKSIDYISGRGWISLPCLPVYCIVATSCETVYGSWIVLWKQIIRLYFVVLKIEKCILK